MYKLEFFKAPYKVQSGINDGDDFALSGTNPAIDKNYETKLRDPGLEFIKHIST